MTAHLVYFFFSSLSFSFSFFSSFNFLIFFFFIFLAAGWLTGGSFMPEMRMNSIEKRTSRFWCNSQQDKRCGYTHGLPPLIGAHKLHNEQTNTLAHTVRACGMHSLNGCVHCDLWANRAEYTHYSCCVYTETYTAPYMSPCDWHGWANSRAHWNQNERYGLQFSHRIHFYRTCALLYFILFNSLLKKLIRNEGDDDEGGDDEKKETAIGCDVCECARIEMCKLGLRLFDIFFSPF